MFKKVSICVFLCFIISFLFAQDDEQAKRLRVAFLPHFVENITWKGERNFETFTIGYLGNDPVIEKNIQELLISHPKIKNKKVVFERYTSVKQMKPVPCLYIDEKYNNSLSEIYRKIGSFQTLLITSRCEDQRNVMINIYQKGSNLSFEINKATIYSQGLFILPNLLLYGGDEIDIAKIYQKSQKEVASALDSLRKEQANGKKYQQEISDLVKNIEQNKRKVAQQESLIRLQFEEVSIQKNELNQSKTEYEQTQKMLLIQKDEIENRKKQLTDQEAILFQKKKKLADYNKKLALHTDKIDEQEKEIITQQNSLDSKEYLIQLQRKILIISVIGGGIVFILSIIIFIGYKNKKKINLKLTEQTVVIEQKSHALEEQAEELLTMNFSLNSQNTQLVQANKQIKDSIDYASRLQLSMLPSMGLMNSMTPNMFLIYKPMHVLSGDFYFYKEIENQVFIAVVDCTGHSVPGALLSMLGYNSLNEIIAQKIYEPGQILNYLHKKITGALVDIEDGMDMSLCRIDKETNTLDFAGAKNPLLYFDKEGNQQIIKATSQSIGGMIDYERDYQTTTLSLDEIDTFYLFSDGYQDQFGGKNDRKITRKKYYQLLENSQGKTMSDQQGFLEEYFEKWKQNTEQTDDVTILGVTL